MLAASVLLAVVVGVAFMVLLLAVGDLRRAERRTSHSQDVLVAANRLERLVLDLETGQRGFILTGQQEFLRPWETARVAFPSRANELRRLVSGDPVQAREATRVAQAGKAYISAYSVPLVKAARRGDPYARSVAATDAGKRRVDALRSDFDRLLGTEQRAAARSQASADAAGRRASAAVGAGLAGCVTLIALYVAYLARMILRPVRHTAVMASRLANGELSARVPETGTGEIGALEHAFNVMGGSLERSRAELAALAAEQAALRRVATLVARGAAPTAVFAAVAEEIGRLLPADRTFMARYQPDATVTVVAGWSASGDSPPIGLVGPLGEGGVSAVVRKTGRPARNDHYAVGPGTDGAALGIRSAVGAPITVEGHLWGVIIVAATGSEPPPPGTEGRLAEFTELVATAVANAEAQAELTASRARIAATADETRRRIERDLHDGAQQQLVTLALQLRAAQAAVPPELDQLKAELERVIGGITSTLDDLREYARGIHPAILADGGLAPALKTLARRSAVPVDLHVRADIRMPEFIEVGAYFVVSEALTNAAKHAHASAVDVAVDVEDGMLRVSVRDDGVGGADSARGSGIVGLKDRVEALGGRLSLHSPRGAGTFMRVELPFAAADGSTPSPTRSTRLPQPLL
jgi:signal transduction histidine kinase